MVYALGENLMISIYKYPVYYNWIISDNLKNNPYTILTSYGIYNHPAPLSHRQSRFILSEFTNVITNMDMITLTKNTFSNQLENVLQPIQKRLLIRM